MKQIVVIYVTDLASI